MVKRNTLHEYYTPTYYYNMKRLSPFYPVRAQTARSIAPLNIHINIEIDVNESFGEIYGLRVYIVRKNERYIFITRTYYKMYEISCNTMNSQNNYE